MDEVIIVATFGQSTQADIDLSSSRDFTDAYLAPGRYSVGCFTDQDVASRTHGNFVDAPGMVPVVVTDPEGFYVSDALSCTGDTDSDHELYGFPAGTLPS